MEYKFLFNNETVPVEAEPAGDNSLSVSIGDSTYRVGYTAVDEHHLRLEIDGRGVNAYVAGTADEKIIVINGTSYRIGDADAADRKGTRKSRAGRTPNEVTAPMPAEVVQVMVEEGDIVEKNQPLIVVSAMKMETTLTAPFNGKVTNVNTSQGAKVMPGEILVDIEKEEED